jgi:SAM-dependent methyltransferase
MPDYDRLARFYDLDTAEVNEDLPFWLALARRSGGPILEIGSGTGRVLVPLAQAGFDVVGVDVSPEMLARARANVEAAGVGPRVRLVEADALSLDLEQRFPLAIVALNSFGHFNNPGEPQRLLTRIRDLLVPGGRLALDLTNPMPGAFGETTGVLIHDYTRPGPRPGWQTVKLRSQVLDPIAQAVDVNLIYDEVGPRGEVSRTLAGFVLRYFYRNELELLFTQAGLVLEDVYGSYELAPLLEESTRLLAIARKTR